MKRAFYATDGLDLITFDRANARNIFIGENSRFYPVTAHDAARCPQFSTARDNRHVLVDRRGAVWLVNITTI